jgi:hypothetical protein
MMEGVSVLGRAWKDSLAKLIGSTKRHLLLSSPFVTHTGTDFLVSSTSPQLRDGGKLTILTDLSPMSVCQGATDPVALQSLSSAVRTVSVHHLPRLHAKVYIADAACAIITSANLTSGGLTANYEYGVKITYQPTVRTVLEDISAYSELGVTISDDRLSTYCAIANTAREAFRRKQAAASRDAQAHFDSALRDAEDELIRFRLAGGAMHTVFAQTVLYLLNRYGPLTTKELHPLIETIHPELCDNTVDRVIEGKRFGKKWKHAVRTAQQQLKKAGLVELSGDRWRVTT